MNYNKSKVGRFGALIPLAMAALLLAGVIFMLHRSGDAVQLAQAAPAANPGLGENVIVVNVTGTINVIDTSTDIVYGPYLSGTLGSPGGSTLDVAVSPDGKTALISNFGDMAVFFVNIIDPFSPSVIISASLPIFAEDIDITADGKFALVTDGGFNQKIVTLDMTSHTVVTTTTLLNAYSNAVAVAPDGTVVVADFFKGNISSLKLEPSGELTYTGSYSYTINAQGMVTPTQSLSSNPLGVTGMPEQGMIENSAGVNEVITTTLMRPVNIAIAPDGQTVLVCNVAPYWSDATSALFHIGVYRITKPGILTFSGVVTGLSRAAQSVAFSPDGLHAYLSGNGIVDQSVPYDPYKNLNQLGILDIYGPGNVHLAMNDAADYPRSSGSQLFGVDTIAMANGKLYLGFPTVSGANNILQIIRTNGVGSYSRAMSGFPTGVGTTPLNLMPNKIYIPIINR